MLSILNKLTLQKKFKKIIVTSNVFGQNKTKQQQQQQQNKKSNITFPFISLIEPLPEPGSRDISHPKRMRYHCTTKSTESIDCSQAI